MPKSIIALMMQKKRINISLSEIKHVRVSNAKMVSGR